MLRAAVLLTVNVVFAFVLALTVMPVALLIAPVLREAPILGFAVLGVSTVVFVTANGLLWRIWRREQGGGKDPAVKVREEWGEE